MILEIGRKESDFVPIFECNCEDTKKYQLKFDGGDSGQYFVAYCQKCYDSDDKQFMISMERVQ